MAVGKRVGEYPLSSAGPSADVRTGTSLISRDLSHLVVQTSKGTDRVGMLTWGHAASLSAQRKTSGFLSPQTLASQDQELSLPVTLSRSEQSRWKVTGIKGLLSLLQPLGAQHSHRDAAAHVSVMSHLRKPQVPSKKQKEKQTQKPPNFQTHRLKATRKIRSHFIKKLFFDSKAIFVPFGEVIVPTAWTSSRLRVRGDWATRGCPAWVWYGQGGRHFHSLPFLQKPKAPQGDTTSRAPNPKTQAPLFTKD